MTIPFQKQYASFYDTWYQDKNYSLETETVLNIFNTHNKNFKNILDLGCGTGKHAYHFANKGYHVTGIDRSAPMIEIAQKNNNQFQDNVDFIISDISNFNLNKKFDCAFSLFAVVSYLITNEQLNYFFKSVHNHLNDNGLFLFDFWFGPAVLNQKPDKRTKETKTNDLIVKRHAKPTLNLLKQTIDIEFAIEEENSSGMKNTWYENHSMRFFFPQEIELLLHYNGFDIIKFSNFPNTTEEISLDSWDVSILARKA